MRWYDAVTGTRFDMSHPIWVERMRNKDKTIKARMDWKIAGELERAGIIHLLPSVTEVAKGADSFGAFGNGARWGLDMAVEALAGLGWPVTPEQLRQAAQAAMDAPREAGSDLHDAFHRIRTGELTTPTPEQAQFAELCEQEVKAYWITEYETEVQFADRDLGFGGTCDLTSTGAGMDWKTVSKTTRETRASECLQIGAYAKHFGWTRARIVYVLQSPIKVVRYEDFDASRLARCWEAFSAALALARLIEGVEK
jgi:hypothetical protein